MNFHKLNQIVNEALIGAGSSAAAPMNTTPVNPQPVVPGSPMNPGTQITPPGEQFKIYQQIATLFRQPKYAQYVGMLPALKDTSIQRKYPELLSSVLNLIKNSTTKIAPPVG